jgi:hypothetical protein
MGRYARHSQRPFGAPFRTRGRCAGPQPEGERPFGSSFGAIELRELLARLAVDRRFIGKLVPAELTVRTFVKIAFPTPSSPFPFYNFPDSSGAESQTVRTARSAPGSPVRAAFGHEFCSRPLSRRRNATWRLRLPRAAPMARRVCGQARRGSACCSAGGTRRDRRCQL